MKIKNIIAGLIVSVGCLANVANATVINVDFVTNTKARHDGTAFDSSTGKYYASGFSGSNVVLDVFDNLAAFESNTVSSTVALSGVAHSSPYFEVMNGVVYRRDGSSTSNFSSFDANTGQRLNTSVIGTMGGSNGSQTFNWGGYSGVNFMDDSSGLYLFGKNTTNNWQLNRMNTDLSVAQTYQFTAASLGFGFVANNHFFSGSSYSQPVINQMMDLTTGIQTSVNFSLAGLGGTYLTNFDYHSSTDTLYISDYSGYERFKVSGASAQFGVPALAQPVPEPTSLAILALGFIGLASRKMKKSA